jgi:glucose/arabinose dehydrogenase
MYPLARIASCMFREPRLLRAPGESSFQEVGMSASVAMAPFVRVSVGCRRRILWISLALASSCLVAAATQAATVPAGFSESVIASGLQRPTAMALAPDGRLFVCEQDGQLRVISGGVLQATPFTTVTVDSSGERGLLGVAFDPAFESNHFVYVYYTATTPSIHNRVSRFTASGDVALAGSEVALLDLEPLGATNHNGGAIHFGPDGRLYVAVGDNANGSNAQTLSNRLGKILRINSDGSIPTDNPFYMPATGANRAIWALGLRNPFTFSFQALTGLMFINDVGENTWEEINRGRAGANYGWPTTEGYTNDPNFQSPIFAYDHSIGCAISGGAFYSPLTTRFPSQYTGGYFFADYCGGWIHVRSRDTGVVTDFADGITSPVDLKVSQDGRLYYLARGSGAGGGVVARIDCTSAPTVTVTANGAHGVVTVPPGGPLNVATTFAPGSAPSVSPVEVYFAVVTPLGTLWMQPGTWTFGSTPVPIYAGSLGSAGPTTLFYARDTSGLPAGQYAWIVIVDDDSNGVPNGAFYDIAFTILQ